jgi:hypothetical protein
MRADHERWKKVIAMAGIATVTPSRNHEADPTIKEKK